MTYQNIAYKPVIYVPNAQSADFSLKPIIAIGTDFAWPTDEYEDYIPAWKVNSDNSLKEVVLNEQTARNCSNPVIIITNEAANYENSNEASFNFQLNLPIQNTTSLYGTLKPYFTEFQIDHRYESDNKSDFYQVAFFLLSNGSHSSKYENQLIQKIDKSDVGKAITGQKLEVLQYLFSETVGVFLVTYEYDWYVLKRNMKNIQVPNSLGHSVSCPCRMKFANEWYQRFYYNWSTGISSIISNDKEGYVKVQCYTNN